MMSKFKLRDLDIFYLSFDEINGDVNWARILSMHPDAKRVHGVLGFSEVHRVCALASTTQRFVTIDGDNWLNDGALDYELDDTDYPHVCFSFSSKNTLNGLTYGNGGVKVYNRDTYAIGDTYKRLEDSTDFCFVLQFYAVKFLASTTVINCTPYQAWRTGYREGIKLSFSGGYPLEDFANNYNTIPAGNLRMLRMWTAVGRTAENGIWGILGARQGLYELVSKYYPQSIHNDYITLEQKWNEIKDLDPEILASKYSTLLRTEFNFDIPELNAQTEEWVKTIYHSSRMSGLIK